MRSSRAEPDRLPVFEALTRCYDEAYEALVREDVDRVAVLLDQCDALMGRVDASGADQQSARDAQASQGRLHAALVTARDSSQSELRRVRSGRRALRCYGKLGPKGLGDRLESRG